MVDVEVGDDRRPLVQGLEAEERRLDAEGNAGDWNVSRVRFGRDWGKALALRTHDCPRVKD